MKLLKKIIKELSAFYEEVDVLSLKTKDNIVKVCFCYCTKPNRILLFKNCVFKVIHYESAILSRDKIKLELLEVDND